jgi:hypothetical protein
MGYGGRGTSLGTVKHSSSTLGGSSGSFARSTNRARVIAPDCIELSPTRDDHRQLAAWPRTATQRLAQQHIERCIADR